MLPFLVLLQNSAILKQKRFGPPFTGLSQRLEEITNQLSKHFDLRSLASVSDWRRRTISEKEVT